ncbi:hypothetical protein CWI42_110160 [Ordospora colligata]|uniref:Uncharacterized protein n=1 Tax=Ordospora colligata OC4 TaxID=1354746 RepID=A0A0B2UI12_9MICR|nr:uncharacterized protein M896_110160 [Ordospora colligata OC4]KHN68988.1 hypothetical protein M896_110160 [Ordospora colligata OC4]TBU14216.1 hypothetical protein CWI40_110160 [Ordospora colligata]TBU17893.1 hypothetical protein CWI42_110160 [Ordospora colligata]
MTDAFPVFTLKVKGAVLVVGGGGGERGFGKANGITVMSSATLERICNYETEDIILDISLYDYESKDRIIEMDDDITWNEYDDETTGWSSIHNDDESESLSIKDKESTFIKEDTMSIRDESSVKCEDRSLSQSNTVNSSEIDKDLVNADKTASLYFACSGEKFFYMLRFDGEKILLIKKVGIRVSSSVFSNDLYVISNKKLYGFHNVIDNPSIINSILDPEKPKKAESTIGDDLEKKYVCKPYKNGNKIAFKQDNGKFCITNNLEGMFITPEAIHKVVFEEDKHTFVFNSRKYMYDKEIGKIAYRDGEIAYYLKGRESVLYFQGSHERSYKIPKITAFSSDRGYITVGTGDGCVYLFEGPVFYGMRRVCGIPITGVGFNNGCVYFSSLDGFVGKKIISKKWNRYLILSILIVLIPVLISIFIK